MKQIKLLIFTSLLVILTACSSPEVAPEVVGFQGSYEYFQTVDDLFQEATDVLEVEVVEETRAFEVIDFPIRSFSVEVNDVHKGSLKKGDQIIVNEMGGIYYQFGLLQSKFIIKGGNIDRGVKKELYQDNYFNSFDDFKEKLKMLKEKNEK